MKDANYRFQIIANLGLLNSMSDEKYLQRYYKAKTGLDLDLDNPKLFNEKLQWLKLHDRKSCYTDMVDKYKAKEVVARIVGDQYVIPTLCVWGNENEIDFKRLPSKFVLKTTHGCGGMYICRGEVPDEEKVRKAMRKALKKNYYYHMREWPYKNVKPRILAEKYMQDGDIKNLTVYKVFNFNGTPKIIQTIQDDKTPEESIDYFDTEWNLLNLRQNYPNSKFHLAKPQTLDEMLRLSAECSKGIPFLRTDWYEINGRVYFSEFTFYSDAGVENFYPEKWNSVLGNWLDLPAKRE